ncbi:MAG TPA: hypothetical protein VLA92_05015 [Candidatus Saccharimonadales bacterium]|nr:hypothetical protein [Candidatus Saccharimonadales bacterium]
MRRFLRWRNADSKLQDLTPEELVSLLPETVHETIDTWPLAALPLGDEAKIDHGAERLRATGTGAVRVTGIIRTWHGGEGESGLSLTVGKPGNMLSVAIPQIDPKFKQLTGLFMDATVESEGLRDEGFVVISGQLQQIHGVEQPNLRRGNQALLRGEVVSVEDRGNMDTYGMGLRFGIDQYADISWNPSRSRTLNSEGITQVGSVVLMGVQAEGSRYMWHPNNDENRHFLVEPPIHQE